MSAIYAHICAQNDAPHFRPHEGWIATSRAQFVVWLRHLEAEAFFEETFLLYVMGKKTNRLGKGLSFL